MAIAPCAPVTKVHGVVVFEPIPFKALFPMFATVDNAALQFNFNNATLLLNNSCGSRVCDAQLREHLLNLLTAHITALANGVNGQPPAGIVGRINSATEGSVSVQAAWSTTVSASQAWYIQTQWGALYWEATARFRLGRYVPPPPGCGYGPGGFGYGSMGNGNCGYNGGSA